MPDTSSQALHAWFRARLDAHALGLLDADEESQFLAHAETCAICGVAMKLHRENALLERPDIEPRLLGHRGTTPG